MRAQLEGALYGLSPTGKLNILFLLQLHALFSVLLPRGRFSCKRKPSSISFNEGKNSITRFVGGVGTIQGWMKLVHPHEGIYTSLYRLSNGNFGGVFFCSHPEPAKPMSGFGVIFFCRSRMSMFRIC